MASNYERGRAFEYVVRDYLLDKLKYVEVIRSSGSHSPADLVGLAGHGKVHLFQCKRGAITSKTRSEIVDFSRNIGLPVALARHGDRKPPIILEFLPPWDCLNDEVQNGCR